jgi:hypothetical protein
MKYQINDIVVLLLDYPLGSENNSDVIPAGEEGVIRSLIITGNAYLVNFNGIERDVLVPETWLE